MTNMISADNAAVLAANGADSTGDSASALPAKARNMAVAADSAGDNAQLTAILAGIQQSRQDMQQGRQDMAKALNAVSSRLGNQRGCGCCCYGSGVGYNIVYATYDMDKSYESGKIALLSYKSPLTSQAEADAVDVIVFLGGSGEYARYLNITNQEFTLDGFAMPGDLPVNLWYVNSYPCSFLRKKDGSGWIPLTPQDIANGDVDLIVDVSHSYLPPENIDGKYMLKCGLFEHNCRGKTFYARIFDGVEWTEEQKKRPATFYLRKDSIYYDRFPEYYSPNVDTSDSEIYTDLIVGKDCESWGSSWGELIEKYGDKPFGVCVFSDKVSLIGIAFAIN